MAGKISDLGQGLGIPPQHTDTQHTESVKKTIFRAEYVECGPSVVLEAAVPGGTEGASCSNDSVGGHTRPQQLRKMPSFDF